MGYHRAGFDVVGVDIAAQPRYPFTFYQADAFSFLAELQADLDFYDAVHASPPCRDHTVYTSRWGVEGSGYALPAIREALIDTDIPWVIENVPGADMRADYRLCGCMFNLPGLRRKRLFETSWCERFEPPPCRHTSPAVTVTGHSGGSSRRDGTAGRGTKSAWCAAMGIDWMTNREMSQAVPPAYTEFVGRELLAVLACNRRQAAG